MRKRHTARATCSNAQGAAPPPLAACVLSSSESSAVWLDDEHVTLIEDGAESGMASATKKRRDETLRIWCSQP